MEFNFDSYDPSLGSEIIPNRFRVNAQKVPKFGNIDGSRTSLIAVRPVSFALLGLASIGFAQPVEDAYRQIELSLTQTQRADRVQIQAIGWVTTGSNTTQLETRIWRETRIEPDLFPDRLFVQTFVDGQLRTSVVADGKQIWRYDHVKKEYSFIPQRGGVADSVSSAVAWSRQDAQRPLRLLIPKNYRWLAMPDGTLTPYGAAIWQLSQKGQDWRGTNLYWYFTPTQALDRLEIHERFDLMGGILQESYMDVRLVYPTTPFTFDFKLNLPSDAKPAQDLPRRIID